MKYIVNSFLVLMLLSCSNGRKKHQTNNNSNTKVSSKSEVSTTKKIDIKLCEDFPKEIIMKYNTDATRLEVIPAKNSTGTSYSCDLKLFFGEKEGDFWKGSIGAYISKTKNPFWQYDPKRNPSIYQKVDLGDKAVLIGNSNELLILKDGIVYFIVPPSSGATTNSGKLNKEIAIEIAKHYKL